MVTKLKGQSKYTKKLIYRKFPTRIWREQSGKIYVFNLPKQCIPGNTEGAAGLLENVMLQSVTVSSVPEQARFETFNGW